MIITNLEYDSNNIEDHEIPVGRGDCCCKCKNQKKLLSHPWVDGKPTENIIGYVCAAPLHPDLGGDKNNFVYISKKHGCCELFDKIPEPLEEFFKDNLKKNV